MLVSTRLPRCSFTVQMEALERYRSGGEQKVTVQHVHVNQGGEAKWGAYLRGRDEPWKSWMKPMRCGRGGSRMITVPPNPGKLRGVGPEPGEALPAGRRQ